MRIHNYTFMIFRQLASWHYTAYTSSTQVSQNYIRPTKKLNHIFCSNKKQQIRFQQVRWRTVSPQSPLGEFDLSLILNIKKNNICVKLVVLRVCCASFEIRKRHRHFHLQFWSLFYARFLTVIYTRYCIKSAKWLNCKTLWCFPFILSCWKLVSCRPTAKNSFMSPIANYKPLISSASGIGPLHAYMNTIHSQISQRGAANLVCNLDATTHSDDASGWLWHNERALNTPAAGCVTGTISRPSDLFPHRDRQDWNTSPSLSFFFSSGRFQAHYWILNQRGLSGTLLNLCIYSFLSPKRGLAVRVARGNHIWGIFLHGWHST